MCRVSNAAFGGRKVIDFSGNSGGKVRRTSAPHKSFCFSKGTARAQNIFWFRCTDMDPEQGGRPNGIHVVFPNLLSARSVFSLWGILYPVDSSLISGWFICNH